MEAVELPVQEEVQRHSQRVHVRFERAVALAAMPVRDLRSHVEVRPQPLLDFTILRFYLHCSAEVGELKVEVLVQEQVARLDVQVRNVVVVQVLNCTSQLQKIKLSRV